VAKLFYEAMFLENLLLISSFGRRRRRSGKTKVVTAAALFVVFGSNLGGEVKATSKHEGKEKRLLLPD